MLIIKIYKFDVNAWSQAACWPQWWKIAHCPHVLSFLIPIKLFVSTIILGWVYKFSCLLKEVFPSLVLRSYQVLSRKPLREFLVSLIMIIIIIAILARKNNGNFINLSLNTVVNLFRYRQYLKLLGTWNWVMYLYTVFISKWTRNRLTKTTTTATNKQVNKQAKKTRTKKNKNQKPKKSGLSQILFLQ